MSDEQNPAPFTQMMGDPVAWRWRYKDGDKWIGVDLRKPTRMQEKHFTIEPLYAPNPSPQTKERGGYNADD